MQQTSTQRNILNADTNNYSTMDNLSLYNRFRIVPEEAKKTIQGGKLKGFTDINPMWRIKMLTQEFGECGFGWYYDEVERWKEGDQEQVCFVKIHLYIKRGNEWSKPIVGVGGSKLISLVGNPQRLETSDEAYKMALTDAISVACKALGMAADVYFEKDRTKYDAFTSQPSQPSQAVQQRRTAARRPEQPRYTPVEQGMFNRMVESFCNGVPAKSGEDYRTAWINYTHAGEAEIAMFDQAVNDYKRATGQL